MQRRQRSQTVKWMADGQKNFFSIEAAFAYYTECALATEEMQPRRAAKYQRKRFEVIARGMVDTCRQYGIKATAAHPRLMRELGK